MAMAHAAFMFMIVPSNTSILFRDFPAATFEGTGGDLIWLVVGNMFFFPIYCECHHPNWLIFCRGAETTNQSFSDKPMWGDGISFRCVGVVLRLHWVVDGLLRSTLFLLDVAHCLPNDSCILGEEVADGHSQQKSWFGSGWNHTFETIKWRCLVYIYVCVILLTWMVDGISPIVPSSGRKTIRKPMVVAHYYTNGSGEFKYSGDGITV